MGFLFWNHFLPLKMSSRFHSLVKKLRAHFFVCHHLHFLTFLFKTKFQLFQNSKSVPDKQCYTNKKASLPIRVSINAKIKFFKPLSSHLNHPNNYTRSKNTSANRNAGNVIKSQLVCNVFVVNGCRPTTRACGRLAFLKRPRRILFPFQPLP